MKGGDLCHHNHYSTLCEWRCECGRTARMPGSAALREGFRAVLIEREAEYRGCIARRMRHAFDGEDGRKVARVKAKHKGDTDHGPLFGGAP